MRVVPLLVLFVCGLTISAAPDLSVANEPAAAVVASAADEADYQALQQQACGQKGGAKASCDGANGHLSLLSRIAVAGRLRRGQKPDTAGHAPTSAHYSPGSVSI